VTAAKKRQKPLNPRYERFAQNIASGMGPAEAYLDSGFSPQSKNTASVSASRMLKRDMVRARIDEILGERAATYEKGLLKAVEKVALTKEWVIRTLMENVERAMQHEAVTDGEGNPTGEYTYQGNVANRALELLGKHLGMYVERKEVGGPGAFTDMDDAALADEVLTQARELGITLTPVKRDGGLKH